ncbi:MAG: hypothetical protein ABSC19_04970 [Syntrophorhabdales bacterium]|jgi:hypothetical protein
MGGGLAIAGSIAGAIITARLTYRFSLKLLRAQNREIAGAKLRAAFAPEMARMRQIQTETCEEVPLEIINDMWKRMAQNWQAVEEFRLYLSNEKKKAYDEAWEEYWFHGPIAYAKKADIGLYFARLEKLFAFTSGRRH